MFKLQSYLNKKINKLVGLPSNKKQEAFRHIFPALKSWKITNGDYLEFGVYKGRAFIEAYNMANKLGFNDMKFYAFDSFEGLPEVCGKDADYEHFYKWQYACSEDEFHQILKASGVDINKVTTVPGFFDKTLTEELKDKLLIQMASIVWVDCDIYESTVPVLEFITDYITSATFIAFDDWFSFGAVPYAG